MFDYGTPKKMWIAYDNGSYEPVDPEGNVKLKPRGANVPDWWVVDQEPDWSPPKFANTTRGKEAAREQRMNAAAEKMPKDGGLFDFGGFNAPKSTGADLPEHGGFTSTMETKPGFAPAKDYTTLLGGGMDDRIRTYAEEDRARAAETKVGNTPKASNTQDYDWSGHEERKLAQKQREEVQPQYQNTGSAQAYTDKNGNVQVKMLRQGGQDPEKRVAPSPDVAGLSGTSDDGGQGVAGAGGGADD